MLQTNGSHMVRVDDVLSFSICLNMLKISDSWDPWSWGLFLHLWSTFTCTGSYVFVVLCFPVIPQAAGPKGYVLMHAKHFQLIRVYLGAQTNLLNRLYQNLVPLRDVKGSIFLPPASAIDVIKRSRLCVCVCLCVYVSVCQHSHGKTDWRTVTARYRPMSRYFRYNIPHAIIRPHKINCLFQVQSFSKLDARKRKINKTHGKTKGIFPLRHIILMFPLSCCIVFRREISIIVILLLQKLKNVRFWKISQLFMYTF